MKYLKTVREVMDFMRDNEVRALWGDGDDYHTVFVAADTMGTMEDELAEALRILGNPTAEPKVVGVLCSKHGNWDKWKKVPEVLECPVCLKDKLAEMGRRIAEAHDQGLREGITRYAHWKDGVQYVGSCGTTLTDALQHRNCL